MSNNINVTIQYGTNNSLVKSLPAGTTVGQVLRDAAIRGALGFGQNVEGRISSVPQPDNITLRDRDVVSVYDKACSKGAGGTVNVTVQYGTGNSLSKSVPAGTTIGQVLGDPAIRGALGFGQNVEGRISSVPQPANITLRNGDVVSVYDKACSKGSKGQAA